MKCFYHQEIDAVGMCMQCGKTACPTCIQDVGGTLLCFSCSFINQQEINNDKQASIQNAKTRIFWSWIVCAIGLIFGTFAGLAQIVETAKTNDSVVLSILVGLLHVPLGGYIFWSMYWSIPVVWGWTKKFANIFDFFVIASPVIWLITLSVCCSVPITIAAYYGVFGGGIYQYFKYRRIAAEQE